MMSLKEKLSKKESSTKIVATLFTIIILSLIFILGIVVELI